MTKSRATTKRRILAAVTELLDAQDGAEVTITEVVRLAGLTRPTFYKAFGDLPTAFAEAAVERIVSALPSAPAVDVPAAARMSVMAEAIGQTLDEVGTHAQFFRRVLGGHGGHIVQQHVVELLAVEFATRSPISPLLAGGPLPVELSSKAIAAAVSWIMLEWFMQGARKPSAEVAAEIGDVIHHSVIGGFGAQPSVEPTQNINETGNKP